VKQYSESRDFIWAKKAQLGPKKAQLELKNPNFSRNANFGRKSPNLVEKAEIKPKGPT
jgi:hypothetical protein